MHSIFPTVLPSSTFAATTSSDMSPYNPGHTHIAPPSSLRISMADDSSWGLDYLERLLRERSNAGHENDRVMQNLLRRAVIWPDLPMVRLLLKLGAHVDENDADGCQPLHSAAKYMGASALSHSFHAHPEIMSTLLEAGAELDPRDRYGNTPLSLAMIGGLASSVRFLLSVGADPTKYGQTSCPVPQYLIDVFNCAGEADAVATLLTASEDVNDRDENDSRPLERAAWLGSPAAVKALLHAGADPNLPGRCGVRALHFAAELMCHPDGEETVAALLQAGAEVDARDGDEVTPLIYAAAKGSSAAVLALLNAGANPSLHDKWGCSPLHTAAHLMGDPRGYEALAALIKTAPTTLNLVNVHGQTPLRLAAVTGSPAAVRLLLDTGADPSIGRPPNSNLVLFAAEMMRHRDGASIIGAMLDMGCDALKPGRAGITMRQFALSTDSLHLIKAVLSRESDPLDVSVQTKMQQLRESYLALPPSSDATEPLELLSYLYSLTCYYPSTILDQREVAIVPNPHPSGKGGFGECWQGTFLGHYPVAMKCAHSSVPHETATRRTLREMEMWKTLRHPNVLPFIGSVTLNSTLYLVSPWMANGDAREFVSRHPDVNRAAILLQAAAGLCYLHTRTPAFVHGDIKAANVLISQDGEARIADFGLSRPAINGISLGYSDIWRTAGNPRWQAPELFRGLDDGEPARRTTESDMFAFGRFMIEIYTGKLPFADMDDHRVFVSLVRGTLLPNRPTEPGVASRGLDDRIWQLITDCCHNEPRRRLTVQELISRLTRL
ncbi:hypothetical protein BOTBODRAFT_378531 [Botryobasidium botryosum FD-172 SS1]|uniref:Protein kinase domain-containing protein n=1 Tax=Botryobasidium botryosum (strain FD-172 SS1) TaxID=930990 RepID=A0A067MYR6_BOTB1|nr:hypothetical protein BOTBODRAFT_378531 [Botryobasidium botryosum FD-172 SS1]